jgi:hypothetical protein
MKKKVLGRFVFLLVELPFLSGCLAHSVGSSDWPLSDTARLFSFDHESYVQLVDPEELPNVFGIFDGETDEEVWRWDLGIPDNDLKAIAWSDDNQHIAFVYHWSKRSMVYLYEVGKEDCVGTFGINGWHHNIYYSRLRDKFLLGEQSIWGFLLAIPVRFSEP